MSTSIGSSRPRRRAALCLGVLSAVAMALVPVQATAADTVVYDNIPSPQPANVSSLGFEATTTSEFGDAVTLAGTVRSGLSTTVLMSSWGCEGGAWGTDTGSNTHCVTNPGATFDEPITLNVYNKNTDGSVGSLVGSVTDTFAIPYRPTGSAACPEDKWMAADGQCYNGFGVPITFNTSSLTFPSHAIVSIAYDTTHYGYSPYGESTDCYGTDGGCGYDSLNVGTNAAPTVGNDDDASDAYVAGQSYAYCDGGLAGTGTFRRDQGCWTGFQPAFRVFKTNTSPGNAEACKKGGWQSFSDPGFKNQGDCVSYAEHQKH